MSEISSQQHVGALPPRSCSGPTTERDMDSNILCFIGNIMEGISPVNVQGGAVVE